MKWIVPRPAILAMAVASVVSGTALPRVSSEVAAGWDTYRRAAEQRIGRELGAANRFLALDFAPDAAAARRTLSSGGTIVARMATADTRGMPLAVPGAMVHHWRGAVLIPGVTLDAVLRTLQDGGRLAAKQEDVLASRVLDRGPDSLRVFLKLQRSKYVTVVYNTEHVVHFRRHGATRASSRSTAVRIAELRDANTPAEREVPPGDDRGFLWRWDASWRYEQVPGGVIAECESISLSRAIPAFASYVVRPLVDATARESMERTLATLRRGT